MRNNDVITIKDLEEMGFRPSTANSIIRQSRDLMVSKGYTFYDRKRLMVVPRKAVNEVLGMEL